MHVTRMLAIAAVASGMMAAGHGTASAQATVPPLFSVLLGGNEVSDTGLANVGDPDGHGSATVKIRGATLCFAIIVDQIDKPMAAHIHRGPAGVNGPVVVTLVPPPAGSPGTSSRCLRGLDAMLLQDIQRNAAGYYINIHTEQFRAGAVRGQLF